MDAIQRASVAALLEDAYASRAAGNQNADTNDRFLDVFTTWLTPDKVELVDMVFDQIDLDRVPESLGLLLLTVTRLTREHFARRDHFIKRVETMLRNNGRNERQVDSVMRGLIK